MNPRINSIVIDYRPEPSEKLEADVLAAFQDGAGRVILSLDTIDSLDTDGVRQLITLLRRARTAGGELALRANKPHVRRTLSVTALDRIFTMVEEAAA